MVDFTALIEDRLYLAEPLGLQVRPRVADRERWEGRLDRPSRWRANMEVVSLMRWGYRVGSLAETEARQVWSTTGMVAVLSPSRSRRLLEKHLAGKPYNAVSLRLGKRRMSISRAGWRGPSGQLSVASDGL
jgi:hypothetical protein